MSFNTQTAGAFKVGQQYRFTLQQMGIKGSNPWVRVAFTHSNEFGRVKSEGTFEDHNYLSVSISAHSGLFIFRIDETLPGVNGALKATLFLVV